MASAPLDAAPSAAPAPAWEALRAELVRFVAARVRDPSAADDIVHEVLLRAVEQLAGPRPPTQLRAWLYRVTRNAIVDYQRLRRPASVPAEELDLPASEAGDEGAVAERELAGCLGPLVATLSPADRAALTLAEVEGLTQAEVARRTGLSLSGAKSRVQRARRRLREAILGCCRVEIDRRGGVVDFAGRPDGTGCDGKSREVVDVSLQDPAGVTGCARCPSTGSN